MAGLYGLGSLGALAGVLFIIGIAVIVLVIVGWVLKSLGLASLAERQGIQNSGLAWVPFADLYILGSLKDEIDVFGSRISNMKMILPIAAGVYIILCFIPFINYLGTVAFWALLTMFLYNFFPMYTSQGILFAVLPGALTLVGLIVPFVGVFGFLSFCIFMFIIKDNVPNNQSYYTPPPQY